MTTKVYNTAKKLMQFRTMSLFMIFFLTFSVIFAQNEKSLIEGQLKELFKLSTSKDYTNAASLIIYNGSDSERNLKSAYNSNDKNELNQVRRVCKKIKAFLDISEKYEFGSLNSKDERYTIEVKFISGGQSLNSIFEFIKIGDTFLLNDID